MLVILYGQTGAGKDYIARKLLGSLGVDAYLAKRPTTRPKRSDKEEAYYQFLTDEAFQRGVEKKKFYFLRYLIIGIMVFTLVLLLKLEIKNLSI